MATKIKHGFLVRTVNPTAEQVRAARVLVDLTQTEAADLVHAKIRTWQQWEAGDRKMHPGFWELFEIKISRIISKQR